LEQLCRSYWYPLYAYVRRRGYSPEDGQDLTQSFFERLLERDLLADLRPAGARFRSFLLHALKNHLASEWTRAHAGKRGGAILSLDDLSPEARYSQEAANAESPDAAFERRWASTVLQQALDRLRQEHVAVGKEPLFDLLADGLTGVAPSQPYAELAIQLGMTEAAVKMAIHRLRKRYGELLRLEVAQTVVTSAEIDQELRHLLSALAAK
jgi:RNA polymerase sigma-70 factor (ECF subfamily)